MRFQGLSINEDRRDLRNIANQWLIDMFKKCVVEVATTVTGTRETLDYSIVNDDVILSFVKECPKLNWLELCIAIQNMRRTSTASYYKSTYLTILRATSLWKINVSLCKFGIKRKINHSSFHRCKNKKKIKNNN